MDGTVRPATKQHSIDFKFNEKRNVFKVTAICLALGAASKG